MEDLLYRSSWAASTVLRIIIVRPKIDKETILPVRSIEVELVTVSECKCDITEPYCLPHSVYADHSFPLGLSRALPKRGHRGGPGGNSSWFLDR